MKRALLLSLVVTCSLSAQERLTKNTLRATPGAPAPKAALKDMAWLSGHWMGNALGGIAEEIWSEPHGGSMMGMFRLIKDGKPWFYEILTITDNGSGSLSIRLKHFNPNLTGWEEKNEVREFPLLAIRDGVFHFEGMAFKPEGDRVTVWLAIEEKDKPAREEIFAYRRITPTAIRKSS